MFTASVLSFIIIPLHNLIWFLNSFALCILSISLQGSLQKIVSVRDNITNAELVSIAEKIYSCNPNVIEALATKLRISEKELQEIKAHWRIANLLFHDLYSAFYT